MLDPPRHGPMRRVVSARFTPKAVRAKRDDVDRIAGDILDGPLAHGRVPANATSSTQVAAPFPLAVIAWILGVPSDDWELLFRWTNEIIGKDDPEYRRPGETPGQTIKRARGELHAYLVGPHRATPARPAGRSRQRADRRHRQRRAAHRRTAARVLRAVRRSGQRDDAQRDQRRAPRVLRAAATSGRSCGPTPSCSPTRSRRSCAGSARSATSRASRPKTASFEGVQIRARRPARAVLRVGEPRRGGVRRPVHVPHRPPPEPAPRVRLRRALLRRSAPRARRDRD